MLLFSNLSIVFVAILLCVTTTPSKKTDIVKFRRIAPNDRRTQTLSNGEMRLEIENGAAIRDESDS